MLTSKLWRVLNDPPTLHPLFWRTIYSTGATQFASRNYRAEELAEKVSLGYLVTLMVMWVLANLAGGVWQMVFLNLLFLILSLPFVLLLGWLLRYSLLNGVINGLLWALRISDLVAHERENGRFDLLWLSPPGALGAIMAMCTACLYRKATLHQFRFQSKILLWAAIPLALIMVVAAQSRAATPHVTYRVLTLIYTLALVAALYLDALHSPIIGSLIGMLMPTYSISRIDARLWTAGVYLLLQIATVVLALGMGLIVLPFIYARLNLTGWCADISPPLLSLLGFYITREAVIRVLWKMLAWQLNADPQEMSFWP